MPPVPSRRRRGARRLPLPPRRHHAARRLPRHLGRQPARRGRRLLRGAALRPPAVRLAHRAPAARARARSPSSSASTCASASSASSSAASSPASAPWCRRSRAWSASAPCGPSCRWASPRRSGTAASPSSARSSAPSGAGSRALIAGVNRTLGIVDAGRGRGAAAIVVSVRARRRGGGSALARHARRARSRGAVVPGRHRASPKGRPGRPRRCVVLELAYADPVLTADDRAADRRAPAGALGARPRRHAARAAARGRAPHAASPTTPRRLRQARRPRRAAGAGRADVDRGVRRRRHRRARGAAHAPGRRAARASARPSWPTCRRRLGRSGRRVTAADVRERAARDFWLEGFRDYLALESGHSANTVEAYLRDLRRLGEFAASQGRARSRARSPAPLLRDFVYLLKDLGLSAGHDPARGVRHPDLLRLPRRRRPRARPIRAIGWRRPGAAASSPTRSSSAEVEALLAAPRRRRAARLAGPRAARAGVRRRAAGVGAVRPRHHRPAAHRESGPGVRQGRQGAAGADRAQRDRRGLGLPASAPARARPRDRAGAACCSMRGASRSRGWARGAS